MDGCNLSLPLLTYSVSFAQFSQTTFRVFCLSSKECSASHCHRHPLVGCSNNKWSVNCTRAPSQFERGFDFYGAMPQSEKVHCHSMHLHECNVLEGLINKFPFRVDCQSIVWVSSCIYFSFICWGMPTGFESITKDSLLVVSSGCGVWKCWTITLTSSANRRRSVVIGIDSRLCDEPKKMCDVQHIRPINAQPNHISSTHTAIVAVMHNPWIGSSAPIPHDAIAIQPSDRTTDNIRKIVRPEAMVCGRLKMRIFE